MLLPTINEIKQNATTRGIALKHTLDCKITYPMTTLADCVISLKVSDEVGFDAFTNAYPETDFFPII